MTTIIDGSAGITFPNGSNAQAAPSKVLQVVNATFNTSTSTTSATYVSTTFSASITPLFSTSKILVTYHVPSSASTGGAGVTTVYRGGTNIAISGGTLQGFGIVNSSTSGSVFGGQGTTYLDSPATTSSTTYTIYLLSGGGNTVSICNYNLTGTITLMEIAQ
jgi:hypothetical protein